MMTQKLASQVVKEINDLIQAHGDLPLINEFADQGDIVIEYQRIPKEDMAGYGLETTHVLMII